jgi:hypothetical protein
MAAARGDQKQPDRAASTAIAEFFGVSPSYLIDPGLDPHIDTQLDLLQALRDSGSVTWRCVPPG